MKKKISILYIIDRIAGIYGTEKHLLELISALDRRIFSPVIVTFHHQVAPEFRKLGIPIFAFDIKNIFYPPNIIYFLRIGYIIKKHKIDIIETYHTSSDILGPIIGKLCRVKSVISNRRDMGFLRTKKHGYIYPIINKLVDRIKVVCKAAVIHHSITERTALDKYQVFYNGVHVDRFPPISSDCKESLRSSLKINLNETVIGIVGNVKPIKGQIHLIETAIDLVETYPNIKFLVVGGGLKNRDNRYLDEIKSGLYQAGLLDKFIFTGHRKDVPDLIQIMDIALMLSETEGCSNVLLEYMASGKPVIATGVGGNTELILDNYNGFVVPTQNGKTFAEKIKFLLEDKNLREQMGKNGFKLAKNKFEFSLSFQKEVELYLKLRSLCEI